MKKNERELLVELSRGSDKAFRELFDTYYKDLVLFAGTYIKDLAACEDIVQQQFVNLWEKRTEARVILSLKSFLLKSVQNACLSELRHLGHENKYAEWIAETSAVYARETEEYIFYSELQGLLQETLAYLTPMQRKCFELNRLQGVPQRKIAEELNISLRTVELRTAEALKILRSYLKRYFSLIIFFLQL